jgi:hypothetical protein
MKKSMITILVALMVGHSWITIAYTVCNDIAFTCGFTRVSLTHYKKGEGEEALGMKEERVLITEKDTVAEFEDFEIDSFPMYSPRITVSHRGNKAVIMFSEVQKTPGHTAFAYTVFTYNADSAPVKTTTSVTRPIEETGGHILLSELYFVQR